MKMNFFIFLRKEVKGIFKRRKKLKEFSKSEEK
jgi:hypothetical protein